jgi:hypothetical protein
MIKKSESTVYLKDFLQLVFSMADGSPLDGLNASASLLEVLKSTSGCRTYSSDVKISMSKQRYGYPDAFVVCGKQKFQKM